MSWDICCRATLSPDSWSLCRLMDSCNFNLSEWSASSMRHTPTVLLTDIWKAVTHPCTSMILAIPKRSHVLGFGDDGGQVHSKGSDACPLSLLAAHIPDPFTNCYLYFRQDGKIEGTTCQHLGIWVLHSKPDPWLVQRDLLKGGVGNTMFGSCVQQGKSPLRQPSGVIGKDSKTKDSGMKRVIISVRGGALMNWQRNAPCSAAPSFYGAAHSHRRGRGLLMGLFWSFGPFACPSKPSGQLSILGPFVKSFEFSQPCNILSFIYVFLKYVCANNVEQSLSSSSSPLS